MNKKAPLIFVLLLWFSGVAIAAPIVSIDADPLTPGIQSSFTTTTGTTLGDSFTVDVVVTGVESSAPLNAFEFDIDFDFTLMSPTGNTRGSFLPSTIANPFVVEANFTAPDINFAMTTIGPFGAVGDGILGSFSFLAFNEGTSILDLNDVILSAPFGIPIALDGINDATIIANAPGGATSVPEPPILLLLGAGLMTLRLFFTKNNNQSKTYLH